MIRPFVQQVVANAAVIGVLVTAMVGVAQFARGVSQGIKEFEWKQAEEGRAMVRAMLSDPGWDAMTMLDFAEGRTYEIVPGTKVLIRPQDVRAALSSAVSGDAPERTDAQRFIIDRYDRLFT